MCLDTFLFRIWTECVPGSFLAPTLRRFLGTLWSGCGDRILCFTYLIPSNCHKTDRQIFSSQAPTQRSLRSRQSWQHSITDISSRHNKSSSCTSATHLVTPTAAADGARLREYKNYFLDYKSHRLACGFEVGLLCQNTRSEPHEYYR